MIGFKTGGITYYFFTFSPYLIESLKKKMSGKKEFPKLDLPFLIESQWRAEFKKLDTDNDGKLHVDDLEKMFYYESRQEAKLFADWYMKDNGDTEGYLNFDSFYGMLIKSPHSEFVLVRWYNGDTEGYLNFDSFYGMLIKSPHSEFVLVRWYNMLRITEEKRLELRIRFDMLDGNRNGKLSANELVKMVQYSFLRLDERISAARNDIKEFSKSMDGYLNFDDFVVLIAQKYPYLIGKPDSEILKQLDA